jgi:hypothetical protein
MAFRRPEYQTIPSSGNSALVLVPGTTCGRLMPHDRVARIEGLLRAPPLQLCLLATARPVRRVAWAHVSELEDPAPWLFGYEMIRTTGIAIPY